MLLTASSAKFVVADNSSGQPARPGRGDTTDVTAQPESDSDFLRSTAEVLGEKPPGWRVDQQLLNWYGYRPELEGHGLSLQGTDTADFSKVLHGGADTDANLFRNLLDLRFNVDTRALIGWKGGTFSLDLQNQSGQNGSDHVGDVQGFDNADADGRTQVSELWYQQVLFDQRLRIKVGKVDANTEFAAPSYTSGFINSSWGYSPTIRPGIECIPGAEQKLWHKKYYDKTNPAGLYGSLQLGHGDGHVSDVTDHLGIAAVWIALYEKAAPDSLGVGMTAVRLSREKGAEFSEQFETSLEGYYNFQVTNYFAIRPDVQYIVHPGGSDAREHALVVTVRAALNF